MKKQLWLPLTTLLWAVSACRVDYINDPYLPQTGPPNLFLPQIIYSMAEGPMFDGRVMGRYTQNYTLTTSGDAFERHGSRRSAGLVGLAFSQQWRNHYFAIGSNVNEMQKQAVLQGFGQYQGIGTAIRAWSWQVSTDQFGDMPYDDAWNNAKGTFPYQSQKYIYQQVDALCDQAIRELDNPVGTVDPLLAGVESVYGGNAAQWKRLVFAVKARLANHVSNKAAYNPARVIELVDQSLRSNADNAVTRFTTLASDLSDRFSFLGPGRGNFLFFRPGRFAIGLLDGTAFGGVRDPRLPLLFNPGTDGVYRGLEPTRGLGTLTVAQVPTMYGKYIYRDTEPFPLVTYAELQFVKAEAALRLNNRPLAHAAYLLGVRAHMEQVGVAAAAITTYLASAAIAQTPAALTLRDVMSQKYIALYGFGCHETWSDLRRHNYSSEVFAGFALPTNLPTENNGVPAQRALATTFSEEDWNRVEFAKVGGMDLNYHVKPIWFATTEE